ncbi:MAG: hypothetical protein V3W20_10695 [Candidatus Neomarinimicrobiota bacterium]
MTLGIAVALRNGYADDIRDAIDNAATPGKIEIYSGTRPATGVAITDQTLLATILFADPCAPNAVAGVLTFDADPDLEDDDAAAGGTATWARILDGDDTFVTDADVGTSGSDINLNSTNITAGGIVRITSGTLTIGNA